jgi:GMP synthase (glutamine-hydrolysing)
MKPSPNFSEPIIEDFPQNLPVFHWHGDAFDLPPDASLLVQGEKCQNQLTLKN